MDRYLHDDDQLWSAFAVGEEFARGEMNDGMTCNLKSLDMAKILIIHELRKFWAGEMKQILNHIIRRTADIENVRILLELGFTFSCNSIGLACRTGNLELVKFLYKNSCPLPSVRDAWAYCKMDIVDWFIKKKIKSEDLPTIKKFDNYADAAELFKRGDVCSDITDFVVKHDKIELLDKCYRPILPSTIIKYGSEKFMIYWRKNVHTMHNLTYGLPCEAAMANNLKILKIIDHVSPLDNVLRHAYNRKFSKHGNVKALTFLKKRKMFQDYKGYANIEVLKWAKQNGIQPFMPDYGVSNMKTMRYLVEDMQVENFSIYAEKYIAKTGNVRLIRYALKHPKIRPNEIYKHVAKYGFLHILKSAKREHFSGNQLLRISITHKQYNIVEWLLSLNFTVRFNTRIKRHIESEGSLDLFQLLEKHIKLTDLMFYHSWHDLQVIEWLVEHECPWSIDLFDIAAKFNIANIVEFILERKLPLRLLNTHCYPKRIKNILNADHSYQF